MTCTGSTKTSCTYSNGDYVTSSSYSNFYPGYPRPSEGNCVFLSTSGSESGQWISGKCETGQGFGCQRNSSESGFPPNYVAKCGTSYYQHGDYCFKPLLPSNETTAEYDCELECGHLTSIQSQEENNFVRNVASESARSLARIGLKWTAEQHYEWADGTRFTDNEYNNFGYDEPSLGNCVAISLVDDLVKSGQWINTPCSSNMTSVCKRSRSKPCVPPAITPSPVPAHCSSPYFFEGSGTIYSPGYPSNYQSDLECEYIISAPAGFVVFFALTSDDYFPDNRSTIALYNTITDTVPFLPRLWYGLAPYDTFYASSTSAMKVKFSSGSSNKYKWAAKYDPVDIRPSGCNQGLLKAPRSISSVDIGDIYSDGRYPSEYPCNYQLEAPSGKRILLHFNFYHTGDPLYVYDGPTSSSPLLATYAGDVSWNLTSSTNQMLVVFHTDIYWSDEGFAASFSAF